MVGQIQASECWQEIGVQGLDLRKRVQVVITKFLSKGSYPREEFHTGRHGDFPHAESRTAEVSM